MKRLHQLTDDEILQWACKRLEVGADKYKNQHLDRYNSVDIMEEVLDAINILQLMVDRIKTQNHTDVSFVTWHTIAMLEEDLNRCISDLFVLDELLPDSLCTDNSVTERVYIKKKDEALNDTKNLQNVREFKRFK